MEKKSFIRWLAKEDFVNTMQSIDAAMIQRVHMSEHWAKRDSKIGEAIKVCITIEELLPKDELQEQVKNRETEKTTNSGNAPELPFNACAPAPINPDTGMHKDYWVLTEEERVKGFRRPVRYVYLHEKCGTTTRMATAIAETYARDPGFYGATFCCKCKDHFPVGKYGEFVWEGTNEKVGV